MDNMGSSHFASAGGANSSPTPTTNSGTGGGSNGTTNSGEHQVLDQQTTGFLNATGSNVASIPSSFEKFPYMVVDQSTELGKFLTRPVKISSFTWSTTDLISDSDFIHPFYSYFNNANIKYKLHNWAYVRCNLHVRFVFNASPFYYGTWMYAWHPMYNTDYDIFIGTTSTDEASHVPLSQLRKVLLTPQTCQSADIDIPFVYPYDFIPTGTAETLKDLGMLRGRPLTTLQSANGEAGSITVSAYAWATDVVLYGNTYSLAMQGGDEYGDGPVSKPATALANFASKLSFMPYIGPFATATSIGASAVASIAKLFGYTNVPVIEDHKPVQNRAFPFMATVDTGFPFDKLSLDCKNELSIDGSVCGTEAIDELVVSNLVQKESFLTKFTWSTEDAEDDLLWTSAVMPQLYVADGDTQFHLNMIPTCWIASMFRFWRGDIIFRFKVNCSAFHKGRMRITFDPLGTASTTAATTMTCYTQIVDISPSTDVEIRVPYQQFRAWCACNLIFNMTQTDTPYGTSGNHHQDEVTNGTISCRVQTVLTSPLATGSIDVLVFVRGAENLEFAMPNIENYKRVIIGADMQGGTLPDDTLSTEEVHIAPPLVPVDHIYLTYMGEQVASLRPLIHRMSSILCKNLTPTSNASQLLVTRLYRKPPHLGYQDYGFWSVMGIVDDETEFDFMWAQPHWLSVISCPFLGNRGSVNWSVCNTGTTSLSHRMIVTRQTMLEHIDAYTEVGTTTDDDEAGKFYYENQHSDGAGAMIQTTSTCRGINFTIPFYSNRKFASNSYNAPFQSSENFNIKTDGFGVGIQTNTSTIVGSSMLHFHAGGGADYTLINFLMIPTMTVLTTLPDIPA